MIPEIYLPANTRGVLPIDVDGNMAIALTTENGVARFRLSEFDALWLASAILDYVVEARIRSQSERSSGGELTADDEGLIVPEISPSSAQSGV